MEKQVIIMEKNFGGGWRLDVQGRMSAALLAEKIQDSDTLLFVDTVTLRFGGAPSTIVVSGPKNYEEELRKLAEEL